MHESVMRWVSDVVVRHWLADADKVLEVGGMNVNGTVRGLFPVAIANHGYLSVDILDGPGVDQIVHPGELPFPDDTFSVVVSTETLEHDPRPWLTVPEMHRVLRPGGRLVLTARGVGCGYHHPPDYWRYTKEAFRLLLGDAGFTVIELLDDPQDPGVFALAVKP